MKTIFAYLLLISLVIATDSVEWSGQYYIGTTFQTGTFPFQFDIYDSADGGTSCYSNTTNITTGEFGEWRTIQTGISTNCNDANTDYWVNIKIDGVDQPPRRLLGTTFKYIRKDTNDAGQVINVTGQIITPNILADFYCNSTECHTISDFLTESEPAWLGNYSSVFSNLNELWTNATNQETEIQDLYASTTCKNGICNSDLQVNGNLVVIGSYINATVTQQNINGSIFPQLTDTFDLGSLSNIWKQIYGYIDWSFIQNAPAESDPFWTADSSTVARIGTCAAGEVVQNTTTGGVECVSPLFSFTEIDSIFIAENSTIWTGINAKVSPGTCAAGEVVQNTTTGGVECVSPLFSFTEIDPSWNANSSLVMYDPIIIDRFGYYQQITTAATAFTAVGMTLPTVIGTPTASVVDPNRLMIRYASLAKINTLGGQSGVYTQTRPLYNPIYSTVIKTDTNIGDRRIWIGLSSAALTTLYPNMTQMASTLTFVGVAFQKMTLAPGDVNEGRWACCSGNGTNMQCTDMGLLVKTNTTYTIIVDWSRNQNLICTAYETDTPANIGTATRTTLLSTGTTALGIHNGQTTLTAAIRYYYIAKGMLKQN